MIKMYESRNIIMYTKNQRQVHSKLKSNIVKLDNSGYYFRAKGAKILVNLYIFEI